MKTLPALVVVVLLICGCATAEQPVARRSMVPRFKLVKAIGPSTIRLELDREYEVREVEFERPRGAPPKDLRIFILVPHDEQSSATFAIGAGGHRKTEETISRAYEGARVTKVPGAISGKPVEWWHYRDSHHLYSTCYTSLLDKAGVEHPVYLDLVANRLERLTSLEEAFSRIELE
jgi:hypothetical protein